MGIRGYDDTARLASLAARLDGPRGLLPALFCLTDPKRTPDLIGLAHALPPAAGLIIRTFGQPAIQDQTPELVAIRQAKGGLCLVSADPELAHSSGADGVHWPERWLTRTHVRASDGLISTSAHSPMALRRAQRLADVVLVSAVFPSNSASAGRPMGPFRLAAHAGRSRKPVYALGGINTRTIKRLKNLGISGAGAVGALTGER
ncbi:thiamine phosphate synthase [Oceanicaulis sp. MMSF_3324]|uniref:thiamine phosphate synthase n=1 Tax=Oceanicaulis sp. MMSF_3324 TaxID=3046702 RepID=UPI00273DC94B|nr:thiamine phosphate synthase [Oceanicaulis sp. MMSF_3324]